MCHLDHLQRFPSKIIGWKNWIQKQLEAARAPNEFNQNQKPNHQERWDRGWTTVHPRDRKRCLVWSRRHQTLNKNGTRGWIKIHPELRVNACTNCRQIRGRRSNKNGETRGWTTNSPPRWRKYTLTSEYQDCHMPLWKKQTHFCVQELVKKIESHPHRETLQADLQQNFTSTTHSATIRRRWSVNWAM